MAAGGHGIWKGNEIRKREVMSNTRFSCELWTLSENYMINIRENILFYTCNSISSRYAFHNEQTEKPTAKSLSIDLLNSPGDRETGIKMIGGVSRSVCGGEHYVFGMLIPEKIHSKPRMSLSGIYVDLIITSLTNI